MQDDMNLTGVKVLSFPNILGFWDSVDLAGRGYKEKEDILEGVSTFCIELNYRNCMEFEDQPFRVTHRTNEFTVHLVCEQALQLVKFSKGEIGMKLDQP